MVAALKNLKNRAVVLAVSQFVCTFASGKSYTTSSLRIPQVLTEARVLGCSGAM